MRVGQNTQLYKIKKNIFLKFFIESLIKRGSFFSFSIIERVSYYKYLVIWIDDKLSFKISVLPKRVNYHSFIVIELVLLLFRPLFLPVLDYDDVIYMHAALSTLKPLDAGDHSALFYYR